MRYDIIIPSSKQDISFLPRVFKYIRKNLVDVNSIFVITSINHFHYLKRYIKNYNVTLLDENKLCSGLTYNSIDVILKSKGEMSRTGWFFQQFLKMGFSQTEYAGEYYLSWDADTLPLSNIQFFDNEGRPLFTKKKEYHKPYFETMKKLINMDKTVDFSFIAEHMMFRTSFVKELLTDVDKSKIEGKFWFEKIINASVTLREPGFSEFETYGTYVWVKHPGYYGTQKLNTFREAGMIRGRYINDKLIEKLSFDLDIASFELFSRPPFPYNYPYIKHRLKHIKKMNFKEFIIYCKSKIIK